MTVAQTSEGRYRDGEGRPDQMDGRHQHHRGGPGDRSGQAALTLQTIGRGGGYGLLACC